MSKPLKLLYLLVPCYNEAATIGAVLAELPTEVTGVTVRVLVADDGSTDDSASIAESCGAEVLRLEHTGLAQTYAAGLKEALARGADYVISLDADGQYDPAALPDVLSLLQADADLVLVERGDSFYQPMTFARHYGHLLGRFITRLTTGLEVADPVTGYRGYSRRAVESLSIKSTYTYTLETLTQVIPLELRFETITVAPRVTTRPSRLFKHPIPYVLKQGRTLVTSAFEHRPPNAVKLGLFLSWFLTAGLAWLGAAFIGITSPVEAQQFLTNNPAGALPLLLLYLLRPVLLVPASILTLTAGILFGPGWGVVAATAGNLLAASTAHFLGSRLGLPTKLEKWLPSTLNGTSFTTILSMRLLGLPHDGVSLVAGAARMSYPLFLLASLLGTLPVTLLIVGVGHGGTAVLTGDASAFLLTLTGGAVLAWTVVTRRLRKGLGVKQVKKRLSVRFVSD